MKKRVYLAVPLIANRDLEGTKKIAEIIERLGCEVTSKWVYDETFSPAYTARGIYERDVNGVKQCEMIVAEVSKPSLGVGMEIMLAHQLGKNVLCLHKGRANISYMLRGMPNVEFIEYSSLKDLEKKLEKAMYDG